MFIWNGYKIQKVLKSKKTIKASFEIPQHQTTTEDPQDDVNEDDLNVSSGDLREDRIPNTLNLDFMSSHARNSFM